MRARIVFAAAVLSLAFSTQAQAIIINYQFALTVAGIHVQTDCPNDFSIRWPSFSCKSSHGNSVPVEVGDRFRGRFQIEQDVSGLADGIYGFTLSSFYIQVGEIELALNRPTGEFGNALDQWVNVGCDYGDPQCFRGSSADPSLVNFVVVGGEIFSFAAYSASGADWPNLYLSAVYNCGRARGPLGEDRDWCGYGGGQFGGVYGDYTITRLPEPSTLTMFWLGLAGLASLRGRTGSRRSRIRGGAR